MPNPIAHFAIHADDVERARSFYEKVLGWTFAAWGPPGFYMIFPDGAEGGGVHGSLQKRQEALSGTGFRGYECTVAIEDPAAISKLAKEHGGDVVFEGVEIPTVGVLMQLRDTEGNVVNAMRYEPS